MQREVRRLLKTEGLDVSTELSFMMCPCSQKTRSFPSSMRKAGKWHGWVLHKPGRPNRHRGMKRGQPCKLLGKCSVNHNEIPSSPWPSRDERLPIPSHRQDRAPSRKPEASTEAGGPAYVPAGRAQKTPRCPPGDTKCCSKGPDGSLGEG